MKTIHIERLKHDNGEWKWLPEAETFNLEGDFGVDEDNLDREICRMGQILVRYGTIAGELQANLKRKEENAKFVQARVSSALRSQYEAAGTRATEAKLNEEVMISIQYQQALGELHLLRAEAISADHWYRSAIKKAEMLNALAFRRNAEMKHAYGRPDQ